MKKATKRRPMPRVLWLRKALQETDNLLALVKADNEATALVATLMGEARYQQMLDALNRYRAWLVEELKPHEVKR